MDLLKLISIVCFVHATTVHCIDKLTREIDPSAEIFDLNQIGNNTKVRENAVIGEKSRIGENSIIGPNVLIGVNCFIDNICELRNGVTVGNDVQIENYTRIEEAVTIGNNCIISKITAGPFNSEFLDKLAGNDRFTNISFAVKIDDGTIISALSTIGEFSVIQKNAYIGMGSEIGSMVTIGENAIVHMDASVPNNTKVEKNEVIFKTPTSTQLYMNCLSYDGVRQFYTEGMTNYPDEPVSSVINIHRMIKIQMQQLINNCQNINIEDFKFMPLIKTLYLMKYHGVNGFKKHHSALHSVTRPDIGADEFVDYLKKFGLHELNDEIHFINGRSRNVLEPKIQNQLIQLLALETDAARYFRISGDTICKMFLEIRSGQRNVKSDQELIAV